MKKGLLTILTATILMIPTMAVEPTNKIMVEDYLDMASVYSQSGNYKKALEYIDMIEKVCPDDTKIKQQKALLLKNLNLNDDSLKTLNEANKLNEDAEAVSVFETTSDANNDFQDEEENLKNPTSTLAGSSPKFGVEFYNKKGREYYLDGEFKKAAEYFNKALEIKKNPASYNNLAMIFWYQGNYHKAVKYFKKAYATDKTYNRSLLNLSLLYKQQNDDKKRLWCLNEAKKANPKDFNPYYLLGQYYVEKGQYKTAIKNFSLSIEGNNNNLDSYLALASALYEIDDFDNTYLVLEKAQTINPKSDKIYYLLAKTSILTGKKREALENIQKAIELNSNTSYYYELAKIEFYLGNYENAKQIFQDQFQEIKNSEIYNYLGLCEYKLKNIEQALEYFRKAIEYGKKPIYYYNAGLCHKSMGNKKLYTTAIEEALKFKPQNYQDYIDLSYIYNDLNKSNYAIAVLDMGIEKYPENKKLYLAKLKLLETLGNTANYIELKNIIINKFGN